MGAAAPSRPKRASRGEVRAWAWIVGALSVLTPWAMLGISPKAAAGAVATTAPTSRAPKRPVVLIVTKKIVYDRSATTSTSTSGGPIYVTAFLEVRPEVKVVVAHHA